MFTRFQPNYIVHIYRTQCMKLTLLKWLIIQFYVFFFTDKLHRVAILILDRNSCSTNLKNDHEYAFFCYPKKYRTHNCITTYSGLNDESKWKRVSEQKKCIIIHFVLFYKYDSSFVFVYILLLFLEHFYELTRFTMQTYNILFVYNIYANAQTLWHILNRMNKWKTKNE